MTAIRTERIMTRRTGHVHIKGTGGSVRWLVLHGYAQSPEHLLESFPDLPGHRYIAPEGFSRFYRRGFEGEVVSSWMTKKHRLDEIEDQRHWLDAVYKAHFAKGKGLKIAFAYSQGSASLMRWLADRSVSFDQIWIWAGSLPEDVSYESLRGKREMTFHFLQGDEDPFLPEPYLGRCAEWAESLDLRFETHSFKGGHHVSPGLLNAYIESFIPRPGESTES